jgi:peroxiredoxin Q/BCP
MLSVGDKAPDFSLPNQDNEDVRLSDFFGKKTVVIYFYPKDDTPGCTAESCSFRDRSDTFSQFNAQVLGISKDDADSHQKFIAKYELPYPLLTDVGGEVATLFGLKKTLGILPARATFVIDTAGVIRLAFSSQLNMQQHSEDALNVVKQLFASSTST